MMSHGKSLQKQPGHGSFMCCHQVFVSMNYIHLFAPLLYPAQLMNQFYWCETSYVVSHSQCMSCGMAYHSLGSETRTSSNKNCVSHTGDCLRTKRLLQIMWLVLWELQDPCLWLCCTRPTVEAKNQDTSTSAASFVNFNDKHNYFN